MIEVVLDANVLVSGATGFAIAESVPGAILRSWSHQAFALVVSEHLIAEVIRTLDKPYFRRRLTAHQVMRVERLLRQNARLVPASGQVRSVATHPEDDLVLDCAIAGNVAYVVTGDRQLQALGSYGGVSILSPRAFLTILEEQQGTEEQGT